MTRLIKAVYENGVLHPCEPLALSEGATIDVAIVTQTSVPRAAGPMDPQQLLDAVKRIAAMPLETASDDQPVGREHDRYLYGDRSEFSRGHDT